MSTTYKEFLVQVLGLFSVVTSFGDFAVRRTKTLKCDPVLIVQNASFPDSSIALNNKTALGRVSNLSACARNCCRHAWCDLALFDGRSCHGVLCSTAHVCQLQSAPQRKSTLQAAFLNNGFQGDTPRNKTLRAEVSILDKSETNRHTGKSPIKAGRVGTPRAVTKEGVAGVSRSNGVSRGNFPKRKFATRRKGRFLHDDEVYIVVKKTVISEPPQGNLGEILDRLQFVNGPSIVTSHMHFSHYQQCVQYVEPENVTRPVHGWVTPRFGSAAFLYQVPNGVPPPLGMRSAVPLGGLGTGSLEVRADGSFHEWTLENQSPGGSAKLGPGPLDLAVLGVRVAAASGTKAALVRTHPPEGYPGVQAISYSGSYPVSKLEIRDRRFFGVEMDLYAYGTLHVRDSSASAVPAIMFTLKIENPTVHSVNVSLLINLPLGLQTDTVRSGGNMDVVSEVESPAQCAAMCNVNKDCMAWSYEKGGCALKGTMPLHAYKHGTTSGVKGFWEIHENKLTCARPGNFPNSGNTTVLSTNTNGPSFAVSDDFRSIWQAFEEKGTLLSSPTDETGFHGSTSVSARLPAGESETLTLILAWYYPHRDHSGEIVGQFYHSNLFKSSIEVANHARLDLVNNLQDIISLQSNIMPPKSFPPSSSLPDWLQDHVLNSLSFWRSGFRVADGRWRQWEAPDCNDVDSVHNDFQRALPYVFLFPDLLESVVRAWAKYQDPNGMIQETLQMQWGCWNRTNRLDTPGGRVMADVTPAFLAQVYLLYTWTGNEELLRDLWPAVTKAALWLMRTSTSGTGLPLRLTCTYDIIYLESYDHTTYNSVMYLLGVRVAEELGRLKGDVGLIQESREAFDHGREMLEEKLWDGERGFFRSWWDHEKGSSDWLMADSLYGQVWAYSMGLGSLLDREKMKSHLKKEKELNETPYGLRVLTTGHKKTVSIKDKIRKRGAASKHVLNNLDNFFTEVSGIQKMTAGARGSRIDKVKLDGNGNGNTHQKPNIHFNPMAGHGGNKTSHFGRLWEVKEKVRKLMVKELVERNDMKRQAKVGSTKPKKTLTSPSDDFINKNKNHTALDKAGKLALANKKIWESFSTRKVTQEKLTHKNCISLEPKTKLNSIWMGSDSDWTTLQIHLGMFPDEALEQAERALEHYRTGLKDLWNIHGLTAGPGYDLDGQPWCTSHYTFHMVLWHIPLALTGQQYSAIGQSLHFEPKSKVPYALPFFTPFASGMVESHLQQGKVAYKVSVTSGELVLKVLTIHDSKFPAKTKIKLRKDGYVKWTRA